MREASALLPDSIQYVDSIMSAVKDADAVVLLTEWNQYRGLNLAEVREAMAGDIFIDLRNVYEKETMRKAGFNYVCVGR